MTSRLERAFDIIEMLAERPEGCALSTLAQQLSLPLSATHRLLTELCECGYVRQQKEQGEYVLTVKLVSLGLSFLSNSGVVDVAQPMLDQLARRSGELVRLAVVDGDSLVFVARAQGAVRGLRYDPDMGLSIPLSCTAAGHALLATLSDDEVRERVERQGFGNPKEYGPHAPTGFESLMPYIYRTRADGYSWISELFAPGMSSMAAAVGAPSTGAIGVVTIAGPLVRLSREKMDALVEPLLETAHQIYAASKASPSFNRLLRT